MSQHVTAVARPVGSAWAILIAMMLASSGASLLFNTGVAPILPAIKADLGMSLSGQAWIVTGYGLAFGVALVAGGRLGDLIGEVRVIVIGFTVFGVGLALSALAAAAPVMIAGRMLQGLGVGLSAPATLSVVVNTFPAARRGFAIGVWGFAHVGGGFIGPLFCVGLMNLGGWRLVFWGGAVFAAASVVITAHTARGYRSVIAGGGYDWLGLVVGGGGLTLLTYGLQHASMGWGAGLTWGSLVVGAILLVMFVILEARSDSPLVDLGLFRASPFRAGFVAQAAVGFIHLPFVTFVGALFLIDVLGYSPTKAGWIIMVMVGLSMMIQPMAGRWVDRSGPRVPLVVALTLQGLALVWIGLVLNPRSGLVDVLIAMVIMGIGVGISMPACYTAGMSTVDTEQAGMGSGVVQMGFLVPAALGTALVTSMIGTLTGARVAAGLGGPVEIDELAVRYAHALQSGELPRARAILTKLPDEVAEVIERAAVGASSSAITTSMLTLSLVVFAGAAFAGVVLRRAPTGR